MKHLWFSLKVGILGHGELQGSSASASPRETPPQVGHAPPEDIFSLLLPGPYDNQVI